LYRTWHIFYNLHNKICDFNGGIFNRRKRNSNKYFKKTTALVPAIATDENTISKRGNKLFVDYN